MEGTVMKPTKLISITLLIVLMALSSIETSWAQPPNDLCGNAIQVFDGVTPYNNINAGTEAPAWSCASGGSDVWFIYTASCSGDVIFSLCNDGAQPTTDYDAAMQIYSTGSCMNLGAAFSLCNDDGCAGIFSPPILNYPVEFGNQYIVRLGGFAGSQGSGHLEIVPQENCVAPIDTILLSPPDAVNEIFTTHTVIALVETDSAPVPDVFIQFQIESGPNSGLTSIPNNGECVPDDCRTDSNGEVSWTYSSSDLGTDTIVAITENIGEVIISSNTVTKTWVITRNVPTLSEWGLIAMAGILGIIGFMVIRRKKASA
jgi:hypothetical protein